MQGIHRPRRARVLSAVALAATVASGPAHALILDTGDGAGVPLKATRPGDSHEAVVAGWSTWDGATDGRTNLLPAGPLTLVAAGMPPTTRFGTAMDGVGATPGRSEWVVAAPSSEPAADPLAGHAADLVGSTDWGQAGDWALGRRIGSALPPFAGIDLIGGATLALVLASKLRRRAV